MSEKNNNNCYAGAIIQSQRLFFPSIFEFGLKFATKTQFILRLCGFNLIPNPHKISLSSWIWQRNKKHLRARNYKLVHPEFHSNGFRKGNMSFAKSVISDNLENVATEERLDLYISLDQLRGRGIVRKLNLYIWLAQLAHSVAIAPVRTKCSLMCQLVFQLRAGI